MPFRSKIVLFLGLTPLLTFTIGSLLGAISCTGANFESCKINGISLGEIIFKLMTTGWLLAISLPALLIYFLFISPRLEVKNQP